MMALLPAHILTRARGLFPFLQQGKVYLNHASTGPLSHRVVAAVEAHLAERSSGSLETYLDDMTMVSALRKDIARLIGAESADRISFQLNTSDGLNVVASGLPWRSGDRVLLNRAEFPANVYPYVNLRRLGVEIDFLSATDGTVPVDAIEAAITPRTRIVALSAVQFLSGFRADLKAIGDLCRRRNILFVVDGIQAVGAVTVDVQAMKIDALSVGCQKWMMAPHGTAFLYINEELQSRIQQSYLGWLAVRTPWDFFNYEQPLDNTAHRYEGGSLNLPGLWGLSAAVATLLEFDPRAIDEHVLTLAESLAADLRTMEGLSVVTPRNRSAHAGIVTLRFTDGTDAEAVVKRMSRRGITLSLREGYLRFSPHFYNTQEEIGMAVSALRESISPTGNART